MTLDPRAADRFRRLPRSEWRTELEALVVQEFRTALLMTGDETVPLDENYFDLGLTSLRATEIKQRLEAGLGVSIDTSVLFGSPTVDRLLDHLLTQPLDGARAPGPGPGPAVEPPAADLRKSLVDDLLSDLYQA
ncbi:acyl carrier protein [Streptomyces sp. NRRL F-2664]|uniref:acyl carrier protein n=1 Tax=Streptomyces sp. NRRL F-2664 TaxID=1463842 RepID=UPI0004CB4F7A|nr:acyl carrier protein [Streptomyces sp. NRRL F-2664]